MMSYLAEALLEEKMSFPVYGMSTGVRECENGCAIEIDLPGYDRDQITVELADGFLTVTAEKQIEQEERDSAGMLMRRRRLTEAQQRSFYVDEEFTEDGITARYSDGVLRLTLARAQQEPPSDARRIRIED